MANVLTVNNEVLTLNGDTLIGDLINDIDFIVGNLINEVNITWEQGGVAIKNGANATASISDYRIRSKGSNSWIERNFEYIAVPSNRWINVMILSQNNTYLGALNHLGEIKSASDISTAADSAELNNDDVRFNNCLVNLTGINPNYRIKLLCGKGTEPVSTGNSNKITPSEASDIKFYSTIKTLNSSDNLNLLEQGIYIYTNTSGNIPINAPSLNTTGKVTVIIIKRKNNNNGARTIVISDQNEFLYRVHNGTSWQDWKIIENWDTIGAALREFEKEINALLINANDISLWEVKSYNSSTGEDLTSSIRLRTGYLSAAIQKIETIPGWEAAVYVFNDSDVYQGVWTGSNIEKSIHWHNSINLTTITNLYSNAKKFKVVLRNATNTSQILTTADYDNIYLFTTTDVTLTKEGAAADAKTTGDKINASFCYRGVLSSGADANDLIDFGLYRWASSKVPTNVPESIANRAGCLICFGPNSAPESVAQMIITYSRTVFVRWKTSSGWLSWKQLAWQDDLMLLPTGDSTDRKDDILSALQNKKYCKLGPGDFYISHFTMPDNTTLEGCGDATKLYYIETEAGPAITMGSKCSVLNLSMVGSSSDLTFNEHFFGATFPEDSTQNLWEDGNVEVPMTGYKHLVLTTPLLPGSYRVYAEITSDNTKDAIAAISFSSSQSTSIGSSTIIDTTTVKIGGRKYDFFTLTETAYSVRLCSRGNSTLSEGHEATWANISIEPVTGRSGIAWNKAENECGFVTNCWFSGFDCSGIILYDTSTPTYRQLLITGCAFRNNNVGIFSRRDSEYNKISNCMITGNNYGMIIRGGNNYITGCGVDSNVIGIQVDQDEGDNTGHGAIANCSLNHSGPMVNGSRQTGYSLIIKDTGREMVTNCTVGFGKILLQNTNGNILSNMSLLSYATVEITDGGCNMFCNSIVRSFTDRPNQVILTNNTQSKVINVYNRSGNELIPITAS